MDSWVRDVRYAVRALRQAPLFTLVAAVTVGLGIGATTTIVSAANAFLRRPLPGVRAPAELVTLHSVSEDGSSFHAFSTRDVRDYQLSRSGLSHLVAYSTFPASVRTDAEPRLRMGMIASGSYFAALGTGAVLGRVFTAEDDRPGAPAVIVLSHSEWRDRFGGDPAVVGRSVTLNGMPATVVGVAEPGFRGHVAALDVSLWLPLAQQAISRERIPSDDRRSSWLELFGRLEPGATAPVVAARLSPLAARLGREAGLDYDRAVDVRPYRPLPAPVVLPAAGFLALLLVLGGVVLLIASINVASILLARAARRRREVAVRLALGASRGRVVRQLVIESLVLFLAGGALGTVLAVLATGALRRARLPMDLPLTLDVGVDGAALGFALLVALLTGIAVGLVPARQAARTDLNQALKSADAGPAGARLGLRGAFVVAQVAASVVLLTAAGLLSRSLGRASAIDLGFQPRGVQAASVELRVMGWDQGQVRRFGEALERRALSLPGAEAAGLTDLLPLTLSNQQTIVAVPGRVAEPGVGLFETDFTSVSPGYFRAMGIALARGRRFEPSDAAGAPAVVIVNETLARRIWGDEDPIGKPLGFGGSEASTAAVVVGVARDAKYRSVGEDQLPMTYVPLAQSRVNRLSLVVKGGAGGAGMGRALEALVRDLAADLPLSANEPLERMTTIALLPGRIAAGLASAFGAVGLLLAAVGLYGVMAYAVTLRRRELGIRMALGAESGWIRRLVLRDGMRLTGIGLVAGLALAAGLARLLRSLLYGLSPFDPVTFGGIALLLAVVTLAAADGPARRAARTEPLEALRAE